ncbi:MAG: type IV toxin-antitoxin system AbiEi family antitoxin domain-containing protein [Porticoccaceae bacterium]|nr:type IV toxin-antitoxin system AbiEi family antitoxin domain-containing protein [Pseudomonadales bacterium]MCP5171007.1 type IV toxin-antitoxin system AbiEi family antitoxin domain-containing protein [Pseudomonadales bacterium]MCP5301755.1 type IV toxin-antitoxin system AbiEi family antitoxin domain-containing protein [Pseudomonadales bacterium]
MGNQVSTRQRRLATVLRHSSGTIRVDDAMDALGLDRSHAAKLLAGWHNQGVLRRVARGLYVPVQPTALGKTQVLEDPWILVPELYSPGYVGGWSALEHWELTEQLFRSVCVLTSKRTAFGNAEHQGVNFFVKHIPDDQIFGTKTIWRDQIKISVSDPYKTVLDIIDDPYLGAGLQHTVDCLKEFKQLYGKQSDFDKLLTYAKLIGNGALFKKLGFLAEVLGFEQTFIDECANNLTTGYTQLDKTATDKSLVTRWRLWIPKGYKF